MPSRFFPPPESANSFGVVEMGGALDQERLLDAYRHGIFPWPMTSKSKLVPWFSPDPRAILELDSLRVSRRLAQTCRSGKFQITSDRDFAGVIAGCATAQDRDDGTWITPELTAAYTDLHRRGHAHSIEAWHEGKLAGGMYAVTVGGLFAGESMFHYVRDASKVVLVRLVEHLGERGYRLFDIQTLTSHTARFGASEISRSEYLKRLAAVVDLPVTFGEIAA